MRKALDMYGEVRYENDDDFYEREWCERNIRALDYDIDEVRQRLHHEMRRQREGHYIANQECHKLENKLQDLYEQRSQIERQVRRYFEDEQEDDYSYLPPRQEIVQKPSVKLESTNMKAKKFLK